MKSKDEKAYVTPRCLQETHSAYTDSAIEYDSSIHDESIGLFNNITYTAQQQPQSRISEYSGLSKRPDKPRSHDSNDELNFLDVDTISDIIGHKRNKNVSTFSIPTIIEEIRHPVFRIPDHDIGIQKDQCVVLDKRINPLKSEAQLQFKSSRYEQHAFSGENSMFCEYEHQSNNNHRYNFDDLFSSESDSNSLLSSPNDNNLPPVPFVSTTTGKHNSRSIWKIAFLSTNLLVLTFIIATSLLLFKQKYLVEPLSNFHVRNINNVLLNEDILLFDISTSAINTNYEEIKVWDLDLDVFLVTDSQNLDLLTDSVNLQQNQVIILLGNSKRFQTPLTFPGTFYNHKVKACESSAEVRLHKPAEHFKYNDDILSGQQWQHILNANYTLLIRGELKYQLPLSETTELLGINFQRCVKV